jgi:NAD(P)-dependent dehydrogenase (short-subunit alcohol dehydrogenase family)
MKTWFITGASTGFGRVLAEQLLESGAKVVATARRPEVLSELAHANADSCLALPLDVTKEGDTSSAVQEAVQRFGGIDVLVNNAGFGFGGAIEEISDADFYEQYDTNVLGQIRVLRHVLPVMRKQRSGVILNITSVVGHRAPAGVGLYSSSKYAFEGITEALRQECAPLGIRVVAVEPGAFRTDFGGRSFKRAEKRIEDYVQTAEVRLEWIRTNAPVMVGDPIKAAKIMMQIAEMDNPPQFFPLGKDSVAGILDKLDRVRADIEAIRHLSESTDYDS